MRGMISISELYYLQLVRGGNGSGTVGNSMLWWRWGGNGYGCDIRDAQVFTGQELLEQYLVGPATSDPGKYRAWPKRHIDRNISIHIDHQHIDRKESIS